ncbi:ABC transporter substrate-binding protein [Paenibacillus sp. MBLB4367]|uniref:ABC transporter substrate-binding protein n=1 Tax=Paenibacillus sp. MBLB4367 TaxID=3384767 RepID=UPI003908322F
MSSKARWYTGLVATAVGLAAITGCVSNPKNEGKDAPSPNTGSTKPASTSPNVNDSNLNPSGFPIVNNKITVKMAGLQGAGNPPLDQMPVYKEYEKMTNIHIDWTSIPSENAAEKKSLLFASNNLPDALTVGLTDQEVLANGSSGTLIPLEGLIDKYAPNLKKLFEAHPEYRKQLMTPEGHIYTLPNINEFSSAETVLMWINQSWLDKLHLQAPQNKDELYKVLKAFKEGDPNGNGKPDEIPFSFMKEDLNLFIANVFGLLNYKNIAVGVDGKMIPTAMDPRYKEALQYLNKLYAEKLIDPEMFSMTSSQQNAKGANEQLGAYFHWSIITAGAKLENQYVAFAPMEYNGKRATYLSSPLGRGHFAITKAAKSPEALIRWADYFFSSEGTKMAEFGPKGTGYVDNADGTWEQAPVPQGMTSVQFRLSMTPSAGGSMPYYYSSSLLDATKLNDYDKKVVASANKYNMPYAKMAFPNTYMTEDEQKKVASIQTDIANYVTQMEVKFIMGDTSFDQWDKFTDTLKKMQMDEMVNVYQKVYDRYQKSN